MISPRPFVSVVVLNYNGIKYLDACLGSLERLDYPRDRYEIVVVDNVSRDGSVEAAEERYPLVRVVRNGRNLGFAGGNNVAMRGATADYVVLLNNDTAVEPEWLSALVKAAENDPAAGACTSKLLFQHDRVRVRLEVEGFRPSEDGSTDERMLGVQLFGAETEQDGEVQRAEYLEGFYGEEPSPWGPFRWSGPEAILGLRMRRDGGPVVIRLRVRVRGQGSGVGGEEKAWPSARPELKVRAERGKPTEGAGTPLSAFSALRFTQPAHLSAGEPSNTKPLTGPVVLDAELPVGAVAAATPVIQNAGTLMLRGGAGRDRGAVVRGTEVFQEDDQGQYERREEVFAGCGAALLLRRTALEDMGVFDDDFFMYYEDMDLSWRMRRRGWKVVYVPDAVVRHVHCGSSVEWSPLFVFHVERNRLLMLAKNAPLRIAAGEWVRYFAGVAVNMGRFARAVVVRSPELAGVHRHVGIRLRVVASLVRLLPSTIAKRRELGRRAVVPAGKLMREWVSG